MSRSFTKIGRMASKHSAKFFKKDATRRMRREAKHSIEVGKECPLKLSEVSNIYDSPRDSYTSYMSPRFTQWLNPNKANKFARK